jgi:ATP-GRASP peptide maturase of grasp-with-spasm system
MILVLSTQDWEITTEEVMDWVHALGGRCVRYNGEDLAGTGEYSLELSTEGSGARLDVDGHELRLEDVRAVWYRRGARPALFSVKGKVNDPEVAGQLDEHVRSEMRDAAASMYSLLPDVEWLTRPGETHVNKLRALRLAAQVGLDVPATLITNSRAQLEAFQRRHGRIITKAISDGTAFDVGERKFALYTEEVAPGDVAALPPTFLPTLAQELLEKTYELRVFYLDGACYPMAIFSQRDEQTAVDFRRYNYTRPNRNVPYRLLPETEERIRVLMRRLGLTTGSLDLVRTPEGRLVFLEVNPVGQFGMVSVPCNYFLEKAVAQHLIALAEQ